MRSARIGYSAVIGVIALWVYYSGTGLAYVSLYVVLAVPVLSLLLSLIMIKRIRIIQRLRPDVIVKNNTVALKVKVVNPDIFTYPYVALLLPAGRDIKEISDEKNGMNQKQKQKYAYCSVRFLSTTEIELNISFKYRGFYHVGINEVCVYDFFGLFRLKKKVEHSEAVTVYPQHKSLDELQITPHSGHIDATKRSLVGGDPTEILYVEKYHSLDNMRHIHWKLSTKLDELMVKRFADEAEKGVLLAVDLSLKDYSDTNICDMIDDRIIETALSILDYCIRNGITSEIFYHTQNFVSKICRNAEDYHKIRAELAVVECSGGFQADALVESIAEYNFSETSMVIITNRLNDSIVNALLTRASKHPLLFHVFAGDFLSKEERAETEKSINFLIGKGIVCIQTDASV
ncbi:MAG: DUF58 domain-containing protein [Oscillospiraceae bacterium]|nr:DUF58 domain-containing protein [Oscillospiraceae bacterium]